MLIPIGKAVYCLFVFCLTPNGVNTCVERCECVQRSMHVLTPFGAQGRRIKSFTRQYLWCITITY